jgi:hypothetical protein
MIKANKILIEVTEEKAPLGRPRRRWKDNIKMVTGWGTVAGW